MSKRFFLTLIKTFRFVVKCAYLPYFPTNSLRVIAYSWSVNRQRFLLSTPMETSKLNKNEVNNYLDAQTCHFMSGKGHYCLTCALRPRLLFFLGLLSSTFAESLQISITQWITNSIRIAHWSRMPNFLLRSLPCHFHLKQSLLQKVFLIKYQSLTD